MILRLPEAKFNLPMTRNFPSVLKRMIISPLKTSFEVYMLKIFAPPVINMGDVKAAVNPFFEGSSLIA